MEDGPATRTRASLKSDRGTEAILHQQENVSVSDFELFRTPTSSVRKKKGTKSRTPSGQILSSSIKDIRNFFQKEKENSSTDELRQRRDSHSSHFNTICLSNKRFSNHSSEDSLCSITYEENESNTIAVNANQTNLNNTCSKVLKRSSNNQSEIIDNTSEMARPIVCNYQFQSHLSVFDDLQRKEEIIQLRSKEEKYLKERQDRFSSIQKKLQEKEDQVLKDSASASASASATPSNQSMDVKLVLEMFKDLKKEIAMCRIVDGPDRMQSVEDRQDMLKEENLKMKEELAECRVQNQVLKSVVWQMSNTMQSLDQRVQRLEQNSMKKSIVLNGLVTSVKKNECLQDILNFFETQLGVCPEIEDFFYLNPTSTDPMVITFTTMQDKARIYDNISKLKGLVNTNDQPIYITNYLPAVINETRRRENDILKDNKKETVPAKCNMSRETGPLIIEGQRYQKKITVPTPRQLLNIQEDKLNKLFEMELIQGDEILCESNAIQGFVIQCNNLQTVQDAYIKMKLIHSAASHIVCVYRVPGIKKYECEDYCDDGDITMGRYVLQWMVKNKIDDCAIFLV